MKKIVFYSWQSDLPNSTNRGFIQQSLENAVNIIGIRYKNEGLIFTKYD